MSPGAPHDVVQTAFTLGYDATPTRELAPTGRTVTWTMCMVDCFDGPVIASRRVHYDQPEHLARLPDKRHPGHTPIEGAR